MSRIFLSHSSTNNAAALALVSWLQSQDWSDFFLDISETRGIDPGERWMATVITPRQLGDDVCAGISPDPPR